MVNAADTAFVLFSAALVMLMLPGLALFYGGLVRSKNVLATLMQNFIILGLIGVQWVLFGYSLAFGPDLGGIVGSLEWIGLRGMGLEPFKTYSETVPHQAFMIFQAMFAIITPALITGAWAERLKLSTYFIWECYPKIPRNIFGTQQYFIHVGNRTVTAWSSRSFFQIGKLPLSRG